VTDFTGLFSESPQSTYWYGSDATNVAFWEDPDNFLGGWRFGDFSCSMQDMFAGNAYFNQDLSAWDVSRVTNMSGMFAYATRFNQPLGTWEVTQCAVKYMFTGASSFLNALPVFSDSIAARTKAIDVFEGSRMWAPFGKSNKQTLAAFCEAYRAFHLSGAADMRALREASTYGLARPDIHSPHFVLYDRVLTHPDLGRHLIAFYDGFGTVHKKPGRELRERVFPDAATRKRAHVTGLGTAGTARPRASRRTHSKTAR
jgi:surface protein